MKQPGVGAYYELFSHVAGSSGWQMKSSWALRHLYSTMAAPEASMSASPSTGFPLDLVTNENRSGYQNPKLEGHKFYHTMTFTANFTLSNLADKSGSENCQCVLALLSIQTSRDNRGG